MTGDDAVGMQLIRVGGQDSGEVGGEAADVCAVAPPEQEQPGADFSWPPVERRAPRRL
jgi:hypothetical protein